MENRLNSLAAGVWSLTVWSKCTTISMCVCTHSHNFFVHSLIDRHLVCLHVSAIVNNAAVNMRVQISLRGVISFPSAIYSAVRLLDHMVVLLLFIYLFLTVLGLRFCARAFSSCGERRPLFIAVRGPLSVAASPVAEHRLQMRRLSSCGSRAQLLRGMWDPPRPGLEPVSPALAGRFLTTAPPGKPGGSIFNFSSIHVERIFSQLKSL